MNDIYGTNIAQWGLAMDKTMDDSVRFVTQMLACKLITKSQKDNVAYRVIETREMWNKAYK